MKSVAFLAAAGHALVAAAQHLETSPAGQAVEVDASKTLSDAASAAIGFVRQSAAQPAADAISGALTKLGVPTAGAALVASLLVNQGETAISQLIPTPAPQ